MQDTPQRLVFSAVSADDRFALAALARAAFADDARYRPPHLQPGAPPGHDDPQKHPQWMASHAYYQCTANGDLLGAVILELTPPKGVIHGIQVQPAWMGQGIGSWMLRQVVARWPEIETWSLETPDYALRNHHFYHKNGFTRIAVTPACAELGHGFWHYQKRP